MSRTTVLRSVQVAIDVAVLFVALWLAFELRFDWQLPPEMYQRLAFNGPWVVALQYCLLAALGIPRFSWRYVGLREVSRILLATCLASVVLTAIRVGGADLLKTDETFRYSYLPRGVIAIDLVLAFLGTTGVRTLRRISTEHAEVRKLRSRDTELVRTLLIGAGRAGVMVAKEIGGRPELGILPVGFIDDDPVKLGSVVHGVAVLGGIADVRRIARQKGARQAIVTVSNAPGSAVRAISNACREAGLEIKIIPGLYQLMGGQLNLTRIRSVAIEDLLRREQVVLDDAAISADLRGKVVVVSGAGGSIGSEICRQVSRFGPKRLVLLERSENALFEIHRELIESFPDLFVAPCLADICDRDRLDELFLKQQPEVVFHAAAHKHVPMMEWNPCEAVKNNVGGTQTLADVAAAHGVRSFVMISTDKAVNPTSVMGATKRVAERYIQALATTTATRFVTVRFGNVLGSNGSVVPIFREQIARGGPVTITHRDMKRYFMTIPEACQLVLQAGAMGHGGEIFILDMGEPVRIVDLARDLIQLSGFDPSEIEIKFTGMRPGEKLYEELSVAQENAEKTRHPKIFIGVTRESSLDAVREGVSRLLTVARDGTSDSIRTYLRTLVPEYSEALGVKAASVPPPAEEVEAASPSEALAAAAAMRAVS
jgi:FlaA1/EpsC-like NDP-sugar epimerase